MAEPEDLYPQTPPAKRPDSCAPGDEASGGKNTGGTSQSSRGSSSSSGRRRLLIRLETGPLGMTIAQKLDGTITVAHVDADGAARRAGVRAKTDVLAINGADVTGIPQEEFMQLISSLPRPLTMLIDRRVSSRSASRGVTNSVEPWVSQAESTTAPSSAQAPTAEPEGDGDVEASNALARLQLRLRLKTMRQERIDRQRQARVVRDI